MARRPANVRDLTSAAGLGAVAVVYLLANRHYPLDSMASPGPGVFPLGAGLLALVLAALQAARAVWAAEPAQLPREEPGAVPASRGPYGMIALLAIGIVAIGSLGFLPASFVLALGASRLLGARGWIVPVALAVGVTVATWAIFVVWLGVPLPAGIIRPGG
jgi:hypothetical protein